MPYSWLPAVTARMTTAACRLKPAALEDRLQDVALDLLHEDDDASTISAVVKPSLTSATSTAKAPATKAPMIGMNPPRKVSTASGSTSGTPRTSRPMPMKSASMNPTSACWRMNSDSVVQVF